MSNSEKLNRILDHLENLKSEDVKLRIESMQNLHLIAEGFGISKTRSLLLPFLKEFKDDETDVMLALAKQLKFLGNYISQQEMHLAECVPYFYLCLNYEDIKVIQTAIESLRFLVERFKFKHESIIALGKKLYQTQHTKSMIASVWLCCELAEYIPSKYAGELQKIVIDSANSKVVIVRRYCAYALRYILKDKCPFVQVAEQCLKKLIQDPQDTVKVYAAQTLCFFKHPKSFFMKTIYPLLKTCMDDVSWRVQYAIISQLDNVLISVQSNNKKNIIDFYLQCLNCKEDELVVMAFKNLKNIAMMVEPDIVIKKIIPVLNENSKSENLSIRKAIASSVPYVAPAIGKSNTSTHLQKLVIQILSDKDHQVIQQIFENLQAFDSVLALQTISDSLIPSLKQILEHQNWKLRQSAVLALKILIIKIQDEKLNQQCLDMLTGCLEDRVYEVRKTTLKAFHQLCKEMGQSFTENKALKILSTQAQHTSYLYRLNYFFGLQLIYPYLSAKQLQLEVSNVCKLVKDSVPNVRINVVRTLLVLSQNQNDVEVADKIAKILKFLEKDSDHDIITMVKKINEVGYKTAALAVLSEAQYNQLCQFIRLQEQRDCLIGNGVLTQRVDGDGEYDTFYTLEYSGIYLLYNLQEFLIYQGQC